MIGQSVPVTKSPIPVLSANPGFLGDKVVHASVLETILADGNRAFGIEAADDGLSFVEMSEELLGSFALSVEQYRNPVLFHQILAGGRRAGLVGPAQTFTTCHTPDACPAAFAAMASAVGTFFPLWDRIASLAQGGKWPRMPLAEKDFTSARGVLAELGQRPGEYVLLHVRALARDPSRNLDADKYFATAEHIHRSLGLATLWIGDRHKALPSSPAIIDLSNRSLPVRTLAALAALARAFIGGDSGPLHLAAAAGAHVVSVDRRDGPLNQGFGPFCPPGRGVKLAPEVSTPRAILDAVKCASQSPVVRSAGSAPLPPLPLRITKGYAGVPFYSSIAAGPSSSRIIDLYRRDLRDVTPGADYLPFRTRHFHSAVTFLASLGVRGVSVSAPFKEKAMAFASSLHPVAQAVGALNTLVRHGDEWRGYNTDVGGLTACLEEIGFGGGWAGLRALILGSGGAARAVAFALLRGGAVVSAYSRNDSTLSNLCRTFGAAPVTRPAIASQSFDLVINATGAAGHDPTLAELLERLAPSRVGRYLDLGIGEDCRASVNQIRSRGIRAHDGWRMLEAQARLQIGLFTENPDPVFQRDFAVRAQAQAN